MCYLNAYIWCWMVFDSNGRAFHHLWSLRWNKEFWANKLFIEKQRGGSFLDSKETDFWVLRVFSRFFSTVAICRTSTWTGFTSAWPRWCSSRAPSTPCLSSELSPTDPILLAVTLWSRSLALILSSLWLFILRQITAERQNCGTGSIVEHFRLLVLWLIAATRSSDEPLNFGLCLSSGTRMRNLVKFRPRKGKNEWLILISAILSYSPWALELSFFRAVAATHWFSPTTSTPFNNPTTFFQVRRHPQVGKHRWNPSDVQPPVPASLRNVPRRDALHARLRRHPVPEEEEARGRKFTPDCSGSASFIWPSFDSGHFELEL